MNPLLMSGNDLLMLEERQLRMFLTEVRPAGEEKSELYPEPQIWNASFIGILVSLPYVIQKILDRCGDATTYGRRAQRMLSPLTALHLSGIPFLIGWAREMLLMESGVAGQKPGVAYDDGELAFTDEDAAACLRFIYEATSNYRQDGRLYPSDTRALGSDYRILPSQEAIEIAGKCQNVDEVGARGILGFMASVRSLSFLMEADTRDALMVHGPYPAAEPGRQLIVFECNDLRWPLFPNFPMSGGVRWQLADQPFPTANLAIAFVVREAQVEADRFGTLYIEPLTPQNVVSASLWTRGSDPYIDEGLTQLPLSDVATLRKVCDDVQEFMFLQVANWTDRQKLENGIFQKEMIVLRMLAGAGYTRQELEKEQVVLSDRCQRVYGPHLEKIASRAADQSTFYKALGEFAGGNRPALFTPLTL